MKNTGKKVTRPRKKSEFSPQNLQIRTYKQNKHRNSLEEMEANYVEGEDPFNWTFSRTNVFLDLIISRLPKFRNPKILKLSLWAEILTELNAHYPANVLDVKKLKKKFDNMKKTFVKNKESELEKALQWPYFKRMDEIICYLHDKSDSLPNTSNVVYYEVGGNTEILMDPGVADEPDKGFIWNANATNLLLDIMEEKLSNNAVKIKSFWQVVTDAFISEYESEDVPELDVKKVSKKFSNMKKTYLKNKKKLMDGEPVTYWPYYKQVERIVENHDDNNVKDNQIPLDSEDFSVVDESVEVEEEYQIEVDVKPDVLVNFIKVQESEEDWVEYEMLEEEEPAVPEQAVEVVDLRCRVCYETVTNFKTFGENIQTSSGQEVKIHQAFAFATKYDLQNPEEENIVCFSCTNSLKFVYDFLEKAEESKNKFDERAAIALHPEPQAETEPEPEVKKEEFEIQKDDKVSENSYDFDDLIEEDEREDDNFANSIYEESEDLNVQEEQEKTSEITAKPLMIPARKKIAKFTCTKCFRTFTSETMLRRHIKIVHRLNEYPCVICQKTFSTANLLHRHTSQIHRPGRDFECPQCKKAFQYRERLTAHMRIHSEKTHVCTLCPKAYVTSKELTIHMRSHTNEKPYKCEHCSDSFSQKDRLTLHVKKKHLNIVYKCKYCLAFSSANHNTTRRHEMEHFKFAYECDLCPKKYSKRDRFVHYFFFSF